MGRQPLDAETKAANRRAALQRYAEKNRERLRETARTRMQRVRSEERGLESRANARISAEAYRERSANSTAFNVVLTRGAGIEPKFERRTLCGARTNEQRKTPSDKELGRRTLRGDAADEQRKRKRRSEAEGRQDSEGRQTRAPHAPHKTSKTNGPRASTRQSASTTIDAPSAPAQALDKPVRAARASGHIQAHPPRQFLVPRPMNTKPGRKTRPSNEATPIFTVWGQRVRRDPNEVVTSNQKRCRKLRREGLEDDNGEDSDADVPSGMCGCENTMCQKIHKNESAKRKDWKLFHLKFPDC
ncbi:hypothetical protein C8F04DRAFT_1265544 [Mycena alexandri]|uniref:Uncharacterized protein n=1 Tax=Mycena alexandri TaxID=1745969 RepID=A0AAD6WZ24_9AGAR|nr:hypothetical protein C8F04DRAFT_1265544 [Mycena alexandri]